MSLFAFKALAAFILFAIAYLIGLIPLNSQNYRQNFLTLADIFAGGVFIGTSLFHMLPDALSNYKAVTPHYYLLTLTWCLAGILILLTLEYIVLAVNRHAARYTISTYLLVLVLAIHSLIEGGALGINDLLADTLVIFIAIAAHKGSASFALATQLRKNNFPKLSAHLLITLFSLMAPLGILLASSLTILLHQQAFWLEACFNAFAAGTFLYLGVFHTLREHLFCKQHFNIPKIIALLSGLLLMGVIEIWI